MASVAVFSSARERRLWLWTLAVVLAIYSTLALAQVLTRALLESGVLGASFPLVSFLVAMSLVTATVVAHGLKARPGGVQIAVALGVTAAYLLVFLRMAGPEERSHLIEYGVVGVFIYEALTERASHGRRVPAVPVLAILATAAIGLLDEFIQVFLPSRVFDPLDILFNLLAAAMAVGASVALAWARRWTKSRRAHRRQAASRRSGR